MRGFLNAVFALALLVVIAGSVFAAVAYGRPLTQASSACVGVPAPVRAQADGTGVRAGHVDVRCPGAWSAFQGVLWFSDSADQYGKWSYGGTRTVTGHGDTRIAAWLRPYHGCGFWRQRIIIGTTSRDSATTWFCS